MRLAIWLSAALLGLAGCVPAKIVENDGPQVTYAWNSGDTTLERVYQLAFSYCNGWNAPPRLIADQIDGAQHRSTFECKPHRTLPFGRTTPGRLLNKI